MSDNGRPSATIPLRCNPDTSGEYFRQHNADVEYNQDGIPIVLHFRCRNRECCERNKTDFGVHLYTLYGIQNGKPVGEYITVRVPFLTIADMPLGARVASGAGSNRQT